MPDQTTENAAYADRLREYADLLAQQNDRIEERE